MGCTMTHAEPPRMVHFQGSVLGTNGSRAPVSTTSSNNRQAGLFSRDSSSDTTSSYSNHVTGAGTGNGAGMSPRSDGLGEGGSVCATVAVEPRQLEPRRISAITQFCINRTRAKSITEVELLSVEDGDGDKKKDTGTVKQHQSEAEGQDRD